MVENIPSVHPVLVFADIQPPGNALKNVQQDITTPVKKQHTGGCGKNPGAHPSKNR